jgi:hypothetical protein
MKKSLLISSALFLVFLGLVLYPGGPQHYMVEFKTPGMQSLDIKSARLLHEVNAFQLDGVSASENVVAGLYEVADSGEWIEPDPDQIKALESALGIRVSTDLRTKIRFGMNDMWTDDLHVLNNQNPILRRYLQRHQRTLDELSPIANRKHYSNFYYTGQPFDQPFYSALLPLVSSIRGYARTLRIRARVALAEGRVSDAITDVNVMHRLGHHCMHEGGTTVEVLMGKAVAGMAAENWCEILSHPAITPDDLARISRQVKSAPPISGLKALDVFERLAALDIAMRLEKFGFFGIDHYLGTRFRIGKGQIYLLLGVYFTDWSEIYRRINLHYDQHADILLIDDDQQRREAIKALDNPYESIFKLLEGNDLPIGPALATELTWKFIDELLLDDTLNYIRGLEFARQADEVLQVCIALKKYHFDQQRYPASLEDLKGKYLDEIPLDYGTGEAVHYIPFKAGALVYTTGRNEVDNGGWGYRKLKYTYQTRYDDVTYLVGTDDRPVPEFTKRPLRMIPGRSIGEPGEWDGTRLSLAGANVSLEEITNVSNIEQLKWLDLSACNLPDRWHDILPRLQNLRVLSLAGTEITEEIMAHVAKLPALQTLILNSTDIDGILHPIAGHASLETLYLSRSTVTDDDLQVLTTLPNLSQLNLSETGISDIAAPTISKLSDLTGLYLCGTNITDATLVDISQMDKLKELRVDFTEVTNTGITSLDNHELQTLGLNGTSVNNDLATVLAGRINLQSVFLYETDFNAVVQGTTNAVTFTEKYPADTVTKQYVPKHLAEPEKRNWGELVGVRDRYEILQDENPLRVRLTENESRDNTHEITENGAGVSVLRSITSDFDVRVKVTPDWEQHDEIMTDEVIGTRGWHGGPYLGAGLLIQQSKGHYLKWSWNSICSHSQQAYSRITPEYFIYPRIRNGPLADFAFNFHVIERSEGDNLAFLAHSTLPQYHAHRLSSGTTPMGVEIDIDGHMAFPDLAVEGTLQHFDHESMWLRLKREGNVITAFLSEDGESWTLTSKMKVYFADEVQVGIWCGKLAKSDYVFRFDDFQIEQ